MILQRVATIISCAWVILLVGCVSRPRYAHEITSAQGAASLNACEAGDHVHCIDAATYIARRSKSVSDFDRAERLYKRACEAGHQMGCAGIANLGHHLRTGDLFGFVDHARAVQMLTYACNAQTGRGCTSLGAAYLDGIGVPHDAQRGLGLYQRGCDLGHDHGCRNMAFRYAGGLGVKRDLERARQLFTRACSLGNQESCEQLRRKN